MAVFYSFHYEHDVNRVQLVKNIGAVEGQPLLNSQGWEQVRRGGDAAIEKWIDDQMKWKSAVIVLIGKETSTRPWVCLLYTSPSPRDRQKSRMPSSA